MLDPAGPSARSAAALWWGMFGWFTLVLLAVVSVWLWAVHRRGGAALSSEETPRGAREEAQRGEAEGTRRGMRWIVAGGVLLPLVTVTVVLLFGIPAGDRMLPQPDDAPVVIEVTGHQWWWQVRYPGTTGDGSAIETANQLVIPAGQRVHLHLRTADVIHSFWVPRLAGKLDMVPGRTHVLALQADAPGSYRAQCAEFCGAQHAQMHLVIEALPEEAYAAWLAARRAQRIAMPAAATLALYRAECGDCHRLAGVSAGGSGPDLSDLGSRPWLGAGTLPLEDAASIAHWLREHQQLKPGNRMPTHDHLPAAELDALAAWLAALAPADARVGDGVETGQAADHAAVSRGTP